MSSKKEIPKQTFEGIPKDYTCTVDNGVKQKVEDGDPVWITLKPVVVKAASRDVNRESHGLLVWWMDIDDHEHELAIPKKLIHAQGIDAALKLIDGGLPVVHGKEKALLRYLSVFKIKERLIAATCTGWMGESFVLPNEVINQPEGQQIVYQPEGQSNTAKSIGKKGSFKKWSDGMAGAAPMIKFFVCASLSAPVRFKVNVEAGGFHAFNLTSQGKTTMLQAAASVWGNGVDPQIAGADEAYIQRWNTTSNALEPKAETFNDLAFIIDEIGEGDPKEFGRTIYRVVSGTGKGRANRSGDLRDSRSWRVTILSAGEVAVSDFIESGGGTVKGGQMVRMVDLDLAAIGHLFTGADEANTMKELCATHFGHAGPAMLEKIPDLASDWSDFDQSVVGNASTPIAKRVRARFALAAYTGAIAVDAKILPWTKEEIIDAAKSAYKAWHERINVVSDIDRGVESVKNFILKHESRFETDDDQHSPRDRAGWFRDGLYHFTDESFKEACAGGDVRKIRQALKDASLLHTSTGNKSKIRVHGKLAVVTSVKAEIVEGVPSVPSKESESGTAETRIDTDPFRPFRPESDDLDSQQDIEEKAGTSKSDRNSRNGRNRPSTATVPAVPSEENANGTDGTASMHREEI